MSDTKAPTPPLVTPREALADEKRGTGAAPPVAPARCEMEVGDYGYGRHCGLPAAWLWTAKPGGYVCGRFFFCDKHHNRPDVDWYGRYWLFDRITYEQPAPQPAAALAHPTPPGEEVDPMDAVVCDGCGEVPPHEDELLCSECRAKEAAPPGEVEALRAENTRLKAAAVEPILDALSDSDLTGLRAEMLGREGNDTGRETQRWARRVRAAIEKLQRRRRAASDKHAFRNPTPTPGDNRG